jgi:signal transduction histidine kinase
MDPSQESPQGLTCGWQTMADLQDARVAALQAELAALRAEMQEFTSAVSHDLRAPLRHIVSFAKLVEEDAGPQLGTEVQQFLATITDSARHMGVMLDGLTALSRVGSIPLQMQEVSLQDLVLQVCEGLRGQHDPQALEWRVAADLPLVWADPKLLRQALTQVLDNAIKFSAGSACTVVEVSAEPGADGQFVTLQVRDNGVGYNPALQDQLFKAFGRLHSAQRFAGHGLGLVLVRKIMQRMGGAVSIQAELDAGCCVRLQIAAGPSEVSG